MLQDDAVLVVELGVRPQTGVESLWGWFWIHCVQIDAQAVQQRLLLVVIRAAVHPL